MRTKILGLFFLILAPLYSSSQEVEKGEGVFSFLENKGQWPEFVLYRASTSAGKIYVEQNRILYHFQDFSGMHDAHHGKKVNEDELIKEELIAAYFEGANKVTETIQNNPSQEYFNFFIGNDRSKWASEVRGYSDIRLNELYNGIDLHIYDQKNELKYDFVVSPKADAQQIQMKYVNHQKIKIDRKGNLMIYAKNGQIQESKPYAYQIKNGKIIEVPCDFVLEGNQVHFKLGEYDPKIELVIDPQLIFASYSGAASDNFGMTATYDNDGHLYSGGSAFGNAYPTTAGAYDQNGTFTQVNPVASNNTTYGVTDIFITKYAPDGSTRVYSTYVGGGNQDGGTETVHSMICNEDDELYFFGATSSNDFPMVNSYDNTFGGGTYAALNNIAASYYGTDGTQINGGTDIFVGRLSANGSNLLGSTYVGGSANDGLNHNSPNPGLFGGLVFNYGDQLRGEIMLDSLGDCYIASCSRSTDFPTMSAAQNTLGGEQDGVAFKLSADLSTLIWSTYIGGDNNDACYNIKLNNLLEPYIVGGTASNNLTTTTGAIDENYLGGSTDGFISHLSDDGSTVISSSYIGTNSYDQLYFTEIDRVGNIFVLGQSLGNIPISPNTYNNPGSGQFIMKLSPDLTTIDVSTVFGNGNGQVNISPSAFLVDQCGNIYVSGWGGGISGSLHQTSALTGMPITNDAFQGTSPNGYDFYLIVLSSEAQNLVYGSYIGGGIAQEHVDGGTSRFDKSGIVYQSVCGGCGNNSDFPTYPANVVSSTNNSSNCNNLVFKFQFDIIPKAEFETDLLEGCAPLTIEFENFSSAGDTYEWDFGDGNVIDSIFNPTYTFTDTGTYEVLLTVTDSACNITDSAKKVIEVYPELFLTVSNDTVICDPASFDITANSNGTSNEFHWSSNNNFSDTLNNPMTDSVLTINPVTATYYYVKVSNPYCELTDSVFVNFTSDALEISADTSICKGDNATIGISSNDPSISFTVNWEPTEWIIGNPTDTIINVNPEDPTYFVFNALSSNGCTIIDSILVDVTEIPDSVISASAEPTLVAEGGSTILTAEPAGYTYTWTPPFGLEDPNAQSTEALITQDQIFSVTFSDGKCSNSDTVLVRSAEFKCEDPFIYVPNAFTPDGNGVNDVVKVLGPNIEKLNFAIYDRWGEKVFETQDQNKVWDGTFRDMNCDPDVYVYYLEATCVGDLEHFQKGNITLIR